MALFLSTFTNKIDKKGRVSFPASFRTAISPVLSNGIVIFASHQHPCLEGFDWAKMNEIGDRLENYALFSDEQDELATTIFGQSVHLFLDSEGRISLPEELLQAAKIEEQISFVGLGRKFQIWSPEIFEQRKTQARQAVKDKKLTLEKSAKIQSQSQSQSQSQKDGERT